MNETKLGEGLDKRKCPGIRETKRAGSSSTRSFPGEPDVSWSKGWPRRETPDVIATIGWDSRVPPLVDLDKLQKQPLMVSLTITGAYPRSPLHIPELTYNCGCLLSLSSPVGGSSGILSWNRTVCSVALSHLLPRLLQKEERGELNKIVIRGEEKFNFRESKGPRWERYKKW